MSILSEPHFHNEEAAYARLESIVWPDGPVCPHCGVLDEATELKGKSTVVFSLGYSHPIEYPLPSGIEATVDPKQTKLSVTGIDRQKVGQVAAEMRSLRPPDPYKNKGVRYAGERLKKKVGKTGAK